MPTPCSIPGCRTNRTKSDPLASVFNFPKDSVRRAQWEWAIRQLHDSSYTFRLGNKVCIRHFEGDFVEREHRAVRDDGSILIVPRKAATLTDSAVPTLFDFLPDLHPTGQPIRRPRTIITGLLTLKSELDWRLKDELLGWNVVFNKDLPALSIYKTDISEDLEPEITCSVTFNDQLEVKIVHPSVTDEDVSDALGGESTCNEWNKLSRLIRLLSGELLQERKKCRMKVFESGDVVVLEISPAEPTAQDEVIPSTGNNLVTKTELEKDSMSVGVLQIKQDLHA